MANVTGTTPAGSTASPPPPPVPAPKSADALRLPGQMVRLAGRNWARLLFWFCLGYLVHDLLLRAAVATATVTRIGGFVVLALAVLATLTATILMFHVLRHDLPGLYRMVRTRGDGEFPDTWEEQQARVVDVIGETLLPFLIFYAAWGLLLDDVSRYSLQSLQQGTENPLEINLYVGLVIAVPSWLLSSLCERWFWRKRSILLGISSALLEAGWIFFGVVSVKKFIEDGLQWVTGRVAWAETGQAMGNVVHAYAAVVPFLETLHIQLAWEWTRGVVGDAKDALLLPLIWLAIAAVVYGNEMQRESDVVAGNQRLERLGSGVGQLSGVTRRFLAVLSLEAREKYVPMLNGMRLVLRAGAPVYLFFCVCYVALDYVMAWVWIGVTRLVGPHELWFWEIWTQPLDFGVELVHEVLRVCLLAVSFDLVLRLVNARSAGDVRMPGAQL